MEEGLVCLFVCVFVCVCVCVFVCVCVWLTKLHTRLDGKTIDTLCFLRHYFVFPPASFYAKLDFLFKQHLHNSYILLRTELGITH